MKPLDDIGEVLNDIPDIEQYVTAGFSENVGKYLKRDANGNVMQITDYIGETTNGSFGDYLNRQTNGKNPKDYINQQTKDRGLKDYIEEHGGSTDIGSYIDQQTGGKNVFDYLNDNIGDLSDYLTVNGNVMDYLRESVDDLNSYITTNGNILKYISDKLRASPVDYITANGTPFDYINQQTGGRGIGDYIPEMDKQQVMANIKDLMGDIGNFVQEGLGEALKLVRVENGDEIAGNIINFFKDMFDKASSGISSLMDSGSGILLSQPQSSGLNLENLSGFAGNVGSLLTDTISSELSPLAGNMESLVSNISNFSGKVLPANQATAHSTADIAKSLNPNYTPPAYEEGTPLVGSGETFDSNAQVAVLHEGEAVIPADQNPFNNPLAGERTLQYVNFGLWDEKIPAGFSKLLSRRNTKSLLRGNRSGSFDIEAMKDVEGAVLSTTDLEIQNANINADRDFQLQGVQINQGKKNEEQHNLEIKQNNEGLEQGKTKIKQGEEDKAIQTKITENQNSLNELFKKFYDDWKADRDLIGKFFSDTLNNLMGIHNNTGGIAMILMQTGGKIGGGSSQNTTLANTNLTGSSPAPSPSSNATLDQKADYVYSELIKQGFSKNAAAGIVGNLINENLTSHDHSQSDFYGDGSYAGEGGGMAAWLNERFDNLKSFASSQGKDWTDLGVQTQFLLKELNDIPELKKQLMDGNISVDDAANLFMRDFEKPAAEYARLDKRISSAKDVRQRDNHTISAPVNVSGGSVGDLSVSGSNNVTTGGNQQLTTGSSPTNNATLSVSTPSSTNGNIPHYKQWEWSADGWNSQGITGGSANTVSAGTPVVNTNSNQQAVSGGNVMKMMAQVGKECLGRLLVMLI